ncbi:DUF7130 family rubredoxin-like protein [Haloferacaceae archaeon DSL9]
MSGTDPTSEKPEPIDDLELELGDAVYDADGTEVGVVRGFDDSGFYVAVHGGVAKMSAERATSGEFGEAYLMWRCWECGEMGEIEQLPDACPNCGAPREELYYWTED